MQATIIEYNGHTYIVISFTSNPYYGREEVYHILTNNEKWAAKDIRDIMSAICPKSISRSAGLLQVLGHNVISQINPT